MAGSKESNMTTYKHIVQVHPVENGEVNLSKVNGEMK